MQSADPRQSPTEPATVALVCMPWLLADSPSIQLGMLQAALTRQGIAARSHSLHLAWLAWTHGGAPGDGLLPTEYESLSTEWSNAGAPDWAFTGGPDGARARVGEHEFVRELVAAGMPAELAQRLARQRRRLPSFLAACVDEVLASSPRVVGFTLVYSQTLASVALARALKRRAPGLRIVFGGACCDGPMGPALLRAYPVVDFVVRGEGEAVLPQLVRAVVGADGDADTADGGAARLAAIPGLCWRDGDRVIEVPTDAAQRLPMDELPLPDYDEYFARLRRSVLAGVVQPRIPYQSARGCWWGAKSHCKFCGLNGTDMAFRSREPMRVQQDLVALAKRHAVLDFTVVDNIMDMRYLATLVPALAASPHDLALFCEAKANLTHAQVQLLGAAGVRTIQPGIESLGSSVLRLMGKGVSALQNVRLLRWCAEAGMHVIWNLLYGFPGEDPAEYERMTRLAAALVHLPPPNLGPLMLARFSPYFEAPERHGLLRGAPLPFYRRLYDAPDDVLADLASVFEFEHEDGRDPETYVAPLRAAVQHWRVNAERNRAALTYRRGPGFLVVTDTRTTTPSPMRWQLDAFEAAVYRACDSGATAPTIAAAVERDLGAAAPESRVADVLAEFAASRLLFEDGGRFLALAIPVSASWGRRVAQASELQAVDDRAAPSLPLAPVASLRE